MSDWKISFYTNSDEEFIEAAQLLAGGIDAEQLKKDPIVFINAGDGLAKALIVDAMLSYWADDISEVPRSNHSLLEDKPSEAIDVFARVVKLVKDCPVAFQYHTGRHGSFTEENVKNIRKSLRDEFPEAVGTTTFLSATLPKQDRGLADIRIDYFRPHHSNKWGMAWEVDIRECLQTPHMRKQLNEIIRRSDDLVAHSNEAQAMQRYILSLHT